LIKGRRKRRPAGRFLAPLRAVVEDGGRYEVRSL
jgi:hypothetical protein